MRLQTVILVSQPELARCTAGENLIVIDNGLVFVIRSGAGIIVCAAVEEEFEISISVKDGIIVLEPEFSFSSILISSLESPESSSAPQDTARIRKAINAMKSKMTRITLLLFILIWTPSGHIYPFAILYEKSAGNITGSEKKLQLFYVAGKNVSR